MGAAQREAPLLMPLSTSRTGSGCSWRRCMPRERASGGCRSCISPPTTGIGPTDHLRELARFQALRPTAAAGPMVPEVVVPVADPVAADLVVAAAEKARSLDAR